MGGTMTYTYLGDGTRVAARAGADASSHSSMSPYNYCGNDPVNKFDPDGTGELNGDIGTIDFLDKKGIVFSTPEDDRYHIFTPKDKKYHSYDIFSTLMIKPSIVKAKKR
ncbi:MAG: hypothetical protein MJY50_04405 [Bacteroidales bacterium]|nr:hypothetical protein [Bacteroidales bacterium]